MKKKFLLAAVLVLSAAQLQAAPCENKCWAGVENILTDGPQLMRCMAACLAKEKVGIIRDVAWANFLTRLQKHIDAAAQAAAKAKKDCVTVCQRQEPLKFLRPLCQIRCAQSVEPAAARCVTDAQCAVGQKCLGSMCITPVVTPTKPGKPIVQRPGKPGTGGFICKEKCLRFSSNPTLYKGCMAKC